RIHPALGVLPDGVEQVLDDVLGGIIRPHVPAHEDGEVGVMLAEHPLQPLPMCLGAGVRFPRRQHFRHMRWKSFNGLEAAARAARIYTGTRTRSKVRLGDWGGQHMARPQIRSSNQSCPHLSNATASRVINDAPTRV